MHKSEKDIYKKIVLEKSQNANLIIDGQGLILFATDSTENLSGYKPDEVIDRKFIEFMPEENRNSAEKFVKLFLQSGEEYDEFKVKLKTKNGCEKPCKGFITQVDEKNTKCLLINLFDISFSDTKIKRSSRSRKVLNSVLNNIPFAIAICEADGKFEFVNSKFEEITGYTKKETDSLRSWLKVVLSDRFYADKLFKSFNESCSKSKILNIKRKTGEYKDIEYSLSEIKYGLKLFSFQDVTEIRQSEIALTNSLDLLAANKYLLENQNDKLEILNKKLSESEKELMELNASKDKFFSIIAHDLRSPFNALIGMANLIVKEFDSLDNNEIKALNNNIKSAAEFLLEMLENLLSWSRVNIGSIEFNPEVFDIYDLINEVTNFIGLNAKNKEIEIENKVPKNTNVKADQNMIRSVLQNLLSNAIKFTNRGGNIKFEKGAGQKGFINVSIIDNGIGINKEKVDKIFDITANNSTKGTENEKGTGIGLLLCKEFIIKNKGEISAESIEKEGTKFTFSLPIGD